MFIRIGLFTLKSVSLFYKPNFNALPFSGLAVFLLFLSAYNRCADRTAAY